MPRLPAERRTITNMKSFSDGIVAKKLIGKIYHSYCSKSKCILSFLLKLAIDLFLLFWLPILVWAAGAYSELFLANPLAWVATSSKDLSDISFIVWGVYISIFVALIFKEEKIFGKPFVSFYWSMISSPKNIATPFASWAICFFGFCIWKRISGSAFELGLYSIFLLSCSLISSVIAVAQLIRKQEKVWFSYCKSSGYLAKSPFYRQYLYSNIRMLRKGVLSSTQIQSLYKNSPIVNSLNYLLSQVERSQPIYPDFDYFIDF